MERHESVQDYIEYKADRRSEFIFLRDILCETELGDTVKKGSTCYAIKGENVIGIDIFKSLTGLWLYQDAFLKDENKVLINAQEDTTKALRQWTFKAISEMVNEYDLEAFQNQKDDQETKAVRAKNVDKANELKSKSSADNVLIEAFQSLTAEKQREYSEDIGTAKQEKTELSGRGKANPLILTSVELHDKYK